MVGILSDFKLIGKLFYIKVQGFWVQRFPASPFRLRRAGRAGRVQRRCWPKNGRSNRERNSEKANNEYRSKVFYHYYF
jgi:hypothetical protein